MLIRLRLFFRRLGQNIFNRELMRFFDWTLFAIVVMISLFSVVVIFSATSTEVTAAPDTVLQMLQSQPTSYARLQLLWLAVGIVAMFLIMTFDYQIYGRYYFPLYLANLALLALVLLMEKGRGGMSAFFQWGSDRTFQPSEVGKVIIIIAFAKVFSMRTKPVMTFRDILPLALFMAIPLVLIVAQPDVGTALVYLAIFCVMVLLSGTNYKLILAVLACAVALAVPVWYFLNNSSSENFRLTRILIWLDPDSYPDEARQVVNGQIALGSGGLFGKGIISPGSFASLGYISDDHTDFIFSIVGESFGLVGCCALVVAYMILIGRLIYYVLRIDDPFGSYLIVGVLAMLLFHILENICMVIGLTPVTGIPLPFMSYGGSNMLTNMLAIGLAENVIMRARRNEGHRRIIQPRLKSI